MPRRIVAGFVALLMILAGCGRSQEPTTASTAPAQLSTSTSALQTAQAPPAITEGLTAAVPATRVSLPPPEPPAPPPDPLDGLYGRYSCRFATAGRVTPCCPGATEILAQYWSGGELAIADFIIGRESGCNAGIVNSVGCVGWWQMCGKSCPPNGCGNAESATEKAYQLYLNRGWCDWYLRGDPVTGHAC